jgi:hypothetical protein
LPSQKYIPPLSQLEEIIENKYKISSQKQQTLDNKGLADEKNSEKNSYQIKVYYEKTEKIE